MIVFVATTDDGCVMRAGRGYKDGGHPQGDCVIVTVEQPIPGDDIAEATITFSTEEFKELVRMLGIVA